MDIGHWTLVIGRWSLIIAILLLPGYFTLHLPLWAGKNNAQTTLGERLFLSLLMGVLISGLMGLVLAQIGIFSLGSLLLALAAYSVFCLAFIAAKGEGLSIRPLSTRLGWEEAIIIFLLCLSLWLYAKPAEYILGWLDAGWYVNAGVRVTKTGSLSGESQIFSKLPPAAKPLFYSSFARLRGRFPYFPDTESRGIYLWSFAVADPDKGQVTAYHPPLFSVWIAIFYALGGLRFCLYATPFFGALSVLGLYFAGKTMLGRKIGLLAAFLLAISFTQIYFSRVPYSEIFSQLLLFSGIYALITYIVERKPKRKTYAAVAALSFGQAILSRIENLIVILPLVMFFGCRMMVKRKAPKDLRFFVIPFGLLLADGAVLALTASRPYVELNSYGLWFKVRSFLSQSPALLVIAVVSLGGLLALIILLGLSRSPGGGKARALNRIIYQGRHLITTLLSLAILLLAIYAYFIPPSPRAGAGERSTLAQLGKFMSPFGLWMGIFGLVELIRRGINEKTVFFLALVFSHGLATISVLAISTTRSYVYPIRRQVPVLIPSLVLLASYAILIWNKGGILSLSKGGILSPSIGLRTGLSKDGILSLPVLSVAEGSKGEKLLRVAQLIATAILVVSFLIVGMPYVNQREMQNTVAFSEKLAGHFGERDVVIFEDAWAQDSRVGHFAAPLWSIYDKNALLMSRASVDEAAFPTAIAQWREAGRKVYFISQSELPLLSLNGYELLPIAEERWHSSTITDKLTFPPRTSDFETPFYIYQIVEGESL